MDQIPSKFKDDMCDSLLVDCTTIFNKPLTINYIKVKMLTRSKVDSSFKSHCMSSYSQQMNYSSFYFTIHTLSKKLCWCRMTPPIK